MPEHVRDEKYIVFPRSQFNEWTRVLTSGFGSLGEIPSSVDDAVVIRRQDFFASPALAGYAASIAIAARLTEDEETRKTLLGVADYFQQQSELAAAEGYKLPD